MRRLIIHRQRALMAFGIRYYCVLDRDREEYLKDLEARREPMGVPVENGGNAVLEMDAGAHSFFVVAPRESRPIITGEIPVPPGEEDAVFAILTDMRQGMRIAVTPVNIPEDL